MSIQTEIGGLSISVSLSFRLRSFAVGLFIFRQSSGNEYNARRDQHDRPERRYKFRRKPVGLFSQPVKSDQNEENSAEGAPCRSIADSPAGMSLIWQIDRFFLMIHGFTPFSGYCPPRAGSSRCARRIRWIWIEMLHHRSILFD